LEKNIPLHSYLKMISFKNGRKIFLHKWPYFDHISPSLQLFTPKATIKKPLIFSFFVFAKSD